MPDNLGQAPLSMCISAPVLTKGTTTTLTTTNAIDITIKGRTYTKAALSNTAMPTTDILTSAAFVPVPAGYGCIFILGMNAALTVVMAQSALYPISGTTDGATAKFAPNAPALPMLPDTYVPFGFAVTLVGSGASTFTPGTTTWTTGSSIATTWGDLSMMPDRLIVLGV